MVNSAKCATPTERKQAPQYLARPASFNQESALLAHELRVEKAQNGLSFLWPVGFRCHKEIDAEVLTKALDALVQRHDSLRMGLVRSDAYSERHRQLLLTTYGRTGLFVPGLYEQVICETAIIPTTHIDISCNVDTLLNSVAGTDLSRPMDNGTPPLVRATVARGADSTTTILIVASHLIFDGWSVHIFGKELGQLYNRLYGSGDCSLPPVPVQYPAFTTWEHCRLRSGASDGDVRFWLGHYIHAAKAAIRHHELPFALLQGQIARPSVCVLRSSLSADMTATIKRVASQCGLTPYVICRTAFAIVLHAYTRKSRLALWANFANRAFVGGHNLLGWCATTHLLLTDITNDPTWRELSEQLARQMAHARMHERLPISALWLRTGRRLDLGDTRVNFDVMPGASSRRDGTRNDGEVFEQVIVSGGREWMDLDVRISVQADRYSFVVMFNAVRYSRGGVMEMLAHLSGVLSIMLNDNCRISHCVDGIANHPCSEQPGDSAEH